MWELLKDFLLVSVGTGIGVAFWNGYRRSLDVYFKCWQRS